MCHVSRLRDHAQVKTQDNQRQSSKTNYSILISFKMHNPKFNLPFFALLILLFVNAPLCFGQGDSVYQFREGGGNKKISGSITGVTPLAVTIKTSSGPTEVPASKINKLVFKDQPNGIAKARTRIESGRFDDAIEELEKISGSNPPFVQQEIDFLKAFATSEVALRAGTITAAEAGKAMFGFTQKNANSHHFYEATEILGKLFFAVGKADSAEKEFAKLTSSQWPELVLDGHFYRGEMLNELQKPSEAGAAYDAILSAPANDDLTQSYKLIAKCQKAKSQGLAGNTEEAIKVIEQVIKVENPENTRLFAYAYNALGACHLKAGNIKEAATAYLHTELLFASEQEPHAEALYQLALIWPKLDQTDRASRAREGLKSRYRNSYWATKL